MLNKEQHQLIMGKILRDIYTDVEISSLLGFKGGTCAYFFYNLPRFSVDLDFDLISVEAEAQKLVYHKVETILSQYGQVKDAQIKRHTIFFLLSYGESDHNIKVEINIRLIVSSIKDHYELKEYLGILMQVGKPDYLFSSKLVALTERRETAMRDIYDVWFFAKQNWTINEVVIKERTDKSVVEHLATCISIIEKVKDNETLRGLGELLPGSQDKVWVKTKLREEAVFLLKNYQATLGRRS